MLKVSRYITWIKQIPLRVFSCLIFLAVTDCTRDDTYSNRYRSQDRQVRPPQYQRYPVQYRQQYPVHHPYAEPYPNSRSYRNPYDFPPPAYGGYQDYEQYYVPPVQFNNTYEQTQSNRGDKS